MEKNIRVGVYRILRKFGVNRDEIETDALLIKHVFFDPEEWNCFLFLLETKFDVKIEAAHEMKIHTIEDLIQLIYSEKQLALII